ncbi:MAG TPA: acyltransferase, partial [Pseudonocardiaceae bacterium]|nr:acyltransferase [Pseudonocardiaceae bacterium]
MSAVRRRIPYLPALDGLRGIALAGVVLYHYTLLLPAEVGVPGWAQHAGPLALGVELFFVMSGALITSLLVAEQRQSAQISLRNFYTRRSRRLGPALLAVLGLMVVLTLGWQGQGIDAPLGAHPLVALIAVSGFCGNWILFRVDGGLGWLGPAWSLGVEEQFYLTWPVALRALLRRGATRVRVHLVLAVATLSTVVVSIIVYRTVGGFSYYASPTQLPCILVGVAL